MPGIVMGTGLPAGTGSPAYSILGRKPVEDLPQQISVHPHQLALFAEYGVVPVQPGVHRAEFLPHGVDFSTHTRELFVNDSELPVHICELLTHTSNFLTHAGNLVAHAGKVLAHSGNFLAHAGKVLAHAGNLVAHAGNLVAHTGDIFTDVGQLPVDIRELLAHTGEFFVHTSELAVHLLELLTHTSELFMYTSELRTHFLQGAVYSAEFLEHLVVVGGDSDTEIDDGHVEFVEAAGGGDGDMFQVSHPDLERYGHWGVPLSSGMVASRGRATPAVDEVPGPQARSSRRGMRTASTAARTWSQSVSVKPPDISRAASRQAVSNVFARAG